ncbi:MAG: DUF1840 domain-containing protein [Pseudomonadota bacterium]
MLITFETKAYANITMFGDIAMKLIKYMGHSGSVPGAIKAEDLPNALDKLKAEVLLKMQENNAQDQGSHQYEEDEAFVSLDKRAKPLFELLEAAIAHNTDVMWNQ